MKSTKYSILFPYISSKNESSFRSVLVSLTAETICFNTVSDEKQHWLRHSTQFVEQINCLSANKLLISLGPNSVELPIEMKQDTCCWDRLCKIELLKTKLWNQQGQFMYNLYIYNLYIYILFITSQINARRVNLFKILPQDPALERAANRRKAQNPDEYAYMYFLLRSLFSWAWSLSCSVIDMLQPLLFTLFLFFILSLFWILLCDRNFREEARQSWTSWAVPFILWSLNNFLTRLRFSFASTTAIRSLHCMLSLSQDAWSMTPDSNVHL